MRMPNNPKRTAERYFDLLAFALPRAALASQAFKARLSLSTVATLGDCLPSGAGNCGSASSPRNRRYSASGRITNRSPVSVTVCTAAGSIVAIAFHLSLVRHSS